ncbi:hypothetical protein [Endozoicomonas sp. ALD040]|uniref:hypothetical protein n=1 Tax=Endozoicomonas sp. ALD040 TaxID=3403079 RepID=UPI003BB060F5
MNKKYLFIYTDFLIGGIQTQLLEQCRQLKKRGNEISVVLLTKEYDVSLLNEIKAVATVYFIDDHISSVYRLKFFQRFKIFLFLSCYSVEFRKVLAEADVCHFCNLIGWFFYNLLYYRKLLCCTASFGLYHSAEIIAFERDSYFNKILISKIIDYYPVQNFMATGAVTRNVVADQYYSSQNDVFLLKMGVPIHKSFLSKGKGLKFKIISIGRLVDFKTYNLSMLQVMRELIDDGIDAEYCIYGNGPLSGEINSKIKELGLRDCVHLKDNIAYDKLGDIIDSADCFVGSGTTLILAAGRSCPSIIGIDSLKEPLSYGYIYETEGQYIQEDGLKYQKSKITDIVKSLFNCSDEDYNKIRKKNYIRANEFSLEKSSKDFDDFHDHLVPITKLRFLSIIHIYGVLVFSIFVSFFKDQKVAKSYES